MNTTKASPATSISYGCEDFGRLTQVLLHRPNNSLKLINLHNMGQWLFDQVPDTERFIEEHDRYRELLTSNGVEALELADFVIANRRKIDYMPNLVYLHDIAAITCKGAILSKMAWDARRDEELVVREALTRLGIPIFTEFDEPDDAFEGCLLLSPDTVLVAHTERHRRKSIDKFIPRALAAFSEVIFVEIPKARRYMHPDTIYNRIDHNLALAYLPAFEQTWLHTASGAKEIDFLAHMRRKGIEIVNVTDSEQRRLACSFVPLQPGVMLHYDTALDKETQLRLARKGVEMIFFHPEAMVAGGGSLRCITLRLRREPIPRA
jgi:arginine deiminase